MKTYLDRYFNESMSYFTVEKLTNGLIWVEVAEADLRLCCGCPPDATKFLNKRNLISEASGPNSILLSDAKVKKGRMVSFAEFPVMQMLYMQGMIANAGKDEGLPLIIGMKENVDEQLAYLCRGNYGYFTKTEMIQNGCSAEEAELYFRIKLWFADGKIFRPKELCKPLYLDHKSHLIRNGVYLQRLGYNFFQLRYKDEKILIDLNNRDNLVELPFDLKDSEFKFTSFGVLHSGEGNGWGPENPCMSSLILNEGKIYAVDAGPGFLEVVDHLGLGICDLEGVFLTHIHDDHFAGLPDLLKSSKKLKLFSTPLVSFTIRKKFSGLLGLDERTFRQFFEVIELEMDHWNLIDNMEVLPFFSPHPVETNVYSFRRTSGATSVSYTHLADTISKSNLQKLGDFLSRDFSELAEKFTQKTDIKKVDVGGGFIHGEKSDYEQDSSLKVIYSHTENPSYRENGKEYHDSQFGQQEVLLKGDEEACLRKVFQEIMKSNFRDVDEAECREMFESGRRIKEYRGNIIPLESDELLVIFNGNISGSNVSFKEKIIFDRGHIQGLSEFFSDSAQLMCVNSSFVNAISISRQKFLQIVGKKDSWKTYLKKGKLINMLSSSAIFDGHCRSNLVFHIAKFAETLKFACEDELKSDYLDDVFVLIGGEAYYIVAGKKIKIGHGGFFGGNGVLGGEYRSYKIIFARESEVIKIPATAIADIPLILWRIYENCTTLNHQCKTL